MEKELFSIANIGTGRRYSETNETRYHNVIKGPYGNIYSVAKVAHPKSTEKLALMTHWPCCKEVRFFEGDFDGALEEAIIHDTLDDRHRSCFDFDQNKDMIEYFRLAGVKSSYQYLQHLLQTSSKPYALNADEIRVAFTEWMGQNKFRGKEAFMKFHCVKEVNNAFRAVSLKVDVSTKKDGPVISQLILTLNEYGFITYFAEDN